jgi:hypothetical protein
MAKWDIVIWGRLAGALIIACGVAVSFWYAVDTADDFPGGTSFQVQTFLSQSLFYLSSGMIVVLVAELVGKMRGLLGLERSALANHSPDEVSVQLQRGDEPLDGEPVKTAVGGIIEQMAEWDVAHLGRITGVVLILGGLVLSYWTAFHSFGAEERGGDQWREFFEGGMEWLYAGGLLVLLSEIAQRLWFLPPSGSSEPESDQNMDVSQAP